MFIRKFPLPKNYVDYLEQFELKCTAQLDKVLNENNFYTQKDASEAADLILNMLNMNFNERFSAEQCLRHPFITGRSYHVR